MSTAFRRQEAARYPVRAINHGYHAMAKDLKVSDRCVCLEHALGKTEWGVAEWCGFGTLLAWEGLVWGPLWRLLCEDFVWLRKPFGRIFESLAVWRSYRPSSFWRSSLGLATAVLWRCCYSEGVLAIVHYNGCLRWAWGRVLDEICKFPRPPCVLWRLLPVQPACCVACCYDHSRYRWWLYE